jgi:predicted CopG family antitoxin
MRTTISIDSRVLEELVQATGARSRSAALNQAAEEYLRRKKLDALKAAWSGMRTEDVRREAREADRRRERFLESLT